jgi:hypothetical protein
MYVSKLTKSLFHCGFSQVLRLNICDNMASNWFPLSPIQLKCHTEVVILLVPEHEDDVESIFYN